MDGVYSTSWLRSQAVHTVHSRRRFKLLGSMNDTKQWGRGGASGHTHYNPESITWLHINIPVLYLIFSRCVVDTSLWDMLYNFVCPSLKMCFFYLENHKTAATSKTLKWNAVNYWRCTLHYVSLLCSIAYVALSAWQYSRKRIYRNIHTIFIYTGFFIGHDTHLTYWDQSKLHFDIRAGEAWLWYPVYYINPLSLTLSILRLAGLTCMSELVKLQADR